MNSVELINSARLRFKELEHKQYDWVSFYNGFLEAYSKIISDEQNKEINDNCDIAN